MGDKKEEEAKKQADQEFRDRTKPTEKQAAEKQAAKKQADQEFRGKTNPAGFSTESLIPPTKVTPAITPENRKIKEAKPVTAEQYAINQALREAVPDWVKQNTALKGGAKRTMAKKVREFVRKQGHLPTTSEMHLPSPTPVAGEATLLGQSVNSSSNPWDIILEGVGTPDPITRKYSSYKAKVSPGLVAGAMPTNMFEEFTGVSGSGDYYLIATASTDGRGITSVTIALGATSPPAPAAPTLGTAPFEVSIVVGVIVEGTPYNPWQKSINVQPKEVLREDKGTVGPYELPYQSWWGWSIT